MILLRLSQTFKLIKLKKVCYEKAYYKKTYQKFFEKIISFTIAFISRMNSCFKTLIVFRSKWFAKVFDVLKTSILLFSRMQLKNAFPIKKIL